MPIGDDGHEQHSPEFGTAGELDDQSVVMEEDERDAGAYAAGEAAEAAAAAAPVRAAMCPGEAAAAAEPEVIEAEPLAAVAPPAVAALGPGSRVELLRGRLRELKEPIWGTKQVLWSRLAKAEIRVLEERT